MKLFHFLAVAAFALNAVPIQAQTTVNTVPEGMLTFSLPATGTGENSISYFSLPMTADPVYEDIVSSVTSSTISVANTSAFTGTLANLSQPASAVPYFVKFLTGAQAGRIMLVTGNTTTSLTLDTTDNTSASTEALTGNTDYLTPTSPTPFNVKAGDRFEVFAGDTLASLFGTNTVQNPLVLNGGGSSFTADTIGIYDVAFGIVQAYYFNTTAGYWEVSGSTANANNTILYPYSALTITRRQNEAATSFALTGRVPEVASLIKVPGSSIVIYRSTGYPTDMTLSQLNFGSNWTQGSSSFVADNIAVWDAAFSQFDTYYQLADSTWRESGNAATDQSSFVIPAGTILVINQRNSVSGAASFLQSVLPYTLANTSF